MKKLGVLGTTVLASTILFAGVQSDTANAASVDESQASESVKNLVENNNNYQPKSETQYVIDKEGENPVENSYKVAFGEVPNQAPSFLYVDKDTGDIYDPDGNLVQKASSNTENGGQEENATHHEVEGQQGEVTQPENTTQQEKTEQSKSSVQQLPNTGEEYNNVVFALFGSLLATTGALLSFKQIFRKRQS
ncbi:LPXTG cell wall anchor domain-containing protein [Staphylococcus simulans]|uniref:LPXTG cell wall anchor domain-containing protein n=1 Tax=Staphylococcus simulans TaxID=1286 RepID=UPI000D1E44F4|nr:LPXTG cell wall anchor domain-containing protein [Staphylococcus simulans]MDY5060631.1 LPXTG cell wall anchor domain-containing protein [Staphylococcus simulans]PTJ13096.1 hypothetical protein BU038_11815 [Staphylococcus simulans]